ncbi:recombinase family protein [Occultella glacieicola]|uniref:Recombinase family protein n=1 Tax=Occultella glacieicola TaxID=2518684 RepID=A0ABY2DWH3_9MICO|nr:recombinase family protein [Occultella glacieicola]
MNKARDLLQAATSVLDPSPLRSAVSYIRVSTARQADRGGARDGFSIPAQRDANQRQAYGLGALVAAEFVDRGQSGRNTNCPGLQQMLAYLREHQVDYVIVHKLDRLARSRADDVAITQAIRASGARLISSTEGIDRSHPRTGSNRQDETSTGARRPERAARASK